MKKFLEKRRFGGHRRILPSPSFVFSMCPTPPEDENHKGMHHRSSYFHRQVSSSFESLPPLLPRTPPQHLHFLRFDFPRGRGQDRKKTGRRRTGAVFFVSVGLKIEFVDIDQS